ncbi:MAG: nucleic acid-binding protein [Verrucomicrobiaceae bacterium]|nr:MAG: nucleic acid-binding protein [Verrucomicrobiaceae bacterium]
MILANITFGTLRGRNRDELEDAVETYLALLSKGGQICGERFLTWTKGRLNAHVLLAAPQAMSQKSHTEWGRKNLAQIITLFGREPVLKILDDDAGKTSSGWRGAPSLYLFTNFIDWYSPVCRGDGKRPVPLFALPVTDRIKEGLYGWQREYRALDRIWMESGSLEKQAYRQLAGPLSDLSEEGRRLCREVEDATGVPTFYYLMRYWARSVGEEDRPCPGCGKAWRRPGDRTGKGFHDFDFSCDPCRLVSHVGKSVEGARLARIGEYVPPKPSSRKRKS